MSLSRRNSRRNIAPRENENEKDRELKNLREQVRILKRNEPVPESILGHYSQKEAPEPDTDVPKNAEMTQRGRGQEANNVQEMKKYLTEVLATISAFDRRLTEQLNTN